MIDDVGQREVQASKQRWYRDIFALLLVFLTGKRAFFIDEKQEKK